MTALLGSDGAPICGDCRDWAELFMVRNEVWPIGDRDGWLCIPCLETRLGRQLTPDDFKDCHGHHEVHRYGRGSELLADRLGDACRPSLECRSCIQDVVYDRGFRLVPQSWYWLLRQRLWPRRRFFW